MTNTGLFSRELSSAYAAELDVTSRQSSPIRIRLLSATKDLKEVFRLRYRAYRHDGHLPFDPTEQFCDSNDERKSTVQIAASAGGAFVGALRVSFDCGADEIGNLPCAPYYPEVARLARQPERRLVEFSRLAVDPDIVNLSFRSTLYATLVRAALIAAEARGATDILVATKPPLVKFYELLIGFERMGRPAKYPPGNLDITLMRLTIQQARKRQKMQNRFFRIADDEVARMRGAIEQALAEVMPSRAG